MSNNDLRLIGLEKVKPYALIESTQLYHIESPPMLVDGILPKQTITGLTSYPGVGKTWLAFELMRAIATGTKFLNYFQAEQGSVLFVGSDASIFDYARQWRRLTVQEWSKLAPEETNWQHFENPLDDHVRFLIQSDFMFENLDSVRQLIQTSRQFQWGLPTQTEQGIYRNSGFSLIIFDTLSALTHCNQNDNTQMQEVFRNLRLISEQSRAGVMILHHNSYANEFNDGERWRGAGAQIGALDNWFHLTPSQTDTSLVGVKVKRFRGITPAPFSYEMNVNDEETASLVFSKEDVNNNAKIDDGMSESVINFLHSPVAVGKWFTLKQVSEAIWPEYKELYGNNLKRFTNTVRDHLNHECRKSTPSVVKSGGGQRGIRAEFTAKRKENDASSN